MTFDLRVHRNPCDFKELHVWRGDVLAFAGTGARMLYRDSAAHRHSGFFDVKGSRENVTLIWNNLGELIVDHDVNQFFWVLTCQICDLGQGNCSDCRVSSLPMLQSSHFSEVHQQKILELGGSCGVGSPFSHTDMMFVNVSCRIIMKNYTYITHYI